MSAQVNEKRLPPSLPSQLGLTEEDISQVTKIIKSCKCEKTVGAVEIIDVLAAVAQDENPREAAVYHLQEYYAVLIRSIAYHVLAWERGRNHD